MTRVVHINKEPYDILIDRGTKWGNPYSHKNNTTAKFKVKTRVEAILMYEKWLDIQILEGKLDIEELRNKVLGCWCKPLSCHGDILVNKLKQIENEQFWTQF